MREFFGSEGSQAVTVRPSGIGWPVYLFICLSRHQSIFTWWFYFLIPLPTSQNITNECKLINVDP
jgi:hypothetical protein